MRVTSRLFFIFHTRVTEKGVKLIERKIDMVGLYVGIGILIGCAVTMAIFRWFMVGTLVVDRSNPEEGTYLFLDLDIGPDRIAKRSTVLMRVEERSYLSRK